MVANSTDRGVEPQANKIQQTSELTAPLLEEAFHLLSGKTF